MPKIWSHDCWKLRESIIGRTAYGKTIADVIVSPNHNAYALVFADGSIHDMSTYDDVEIS